MDCALTGLFPVTGATPPQGGEAPSGSGAELAALFASLVAELGGADTDGEFVSAAAVTPAPLAADALPEASEEDAADPPAVSVPVVPWIIAVAPPSGWNLAASQVVTGDATGIAKVGPATPAPAGRVESDVLSSMPQDAAPVMSSAVPDTASLAADGAATANAPRADVSASAAELEAPPQAARALARTLAAFRDPAARPREPIASVSQATPAAASAVPQAPTQAAPWLPASLPAVMESAVFPKASLATPALPSVPDIAPAHPGGNDSAADGGGTQERSPRPQDVPALVVARARAALDSTSEGAAPMTGAAPAPRPIAAAAAPIVERAAPATEQADVPGQIVRAIRIQARDGGGEARLRLNPEFLGDVRIELKVTGDRVSAVLQVERDDVRQQIENSTTALRASLAAHGLTLEEFTVREDGASGRDDPPPERQPSGRRRQRSTTQVFEIPD